MSRALDKRESILFYPITLEGRRGTTDEFAKIPFHFVLFLKREYLMIIFLISHRNHML